EDPDHTKVHKIYTCSSCGRSLENIPAAGYRRRQVFELPPIKIEVTEHRAEEKTCPHCGTNNQAPFPEGVTQPSQYGPRIKAIATYLNVYQLLPYERASELFYDLFGIGLSTATLVNANRTAFEALKPSEEAIKDKIISSPVVHFDETGLYTEGKRWWLHVASTDNLTYYAPHPKRGKEATEDIDILPHFYGVAVHDGWATYFKYGCSHALCNAHHLRELQGVEDFYNQKWATDMALLLVKIKEAVDKESEVSDRLDKESLDSFKDRYDKIISKGLAQNPPAREGLKKRGRPKRSKAENLLYHLKDYWEETLAFMYDFEIPFDNSL
ncbi:MAG: IS66 family transposase, partial [Nitrospirae bacterium CG11_big_fil_rev_8_21_14_0_20_41_14]